MPSDRHRARVAARVAAATLLATISPAGAQPAVEDTPAERAHDSGVDALEAQDYRRAVAELERATSGDPASFDSWLQLGIARAALQDWDGAIAAYEKAIELDPHSAPAEHNLGNVYFRRGDYERAAADYGRALELEPGYMLAAFHYGWCLRQLNRAEEAERAFRRCAELPVTRKREVATHVDCLFGIGSMRHRAGDYAESARYMEQVIEVHPTHPEARYYLAIAYRQLGRLEEARQQFEIHARILESSKPVER